MIPYSEAAHQAEVRINNLATELASRIKSGRGAMIWIGSGLSVGSGYPEWRAAVIELCNVCIPGKADIQPSSVGGELLEWAQKCKEADPTKYTETLARLFGSSPRSIRPAYSNICACPFSYLVTTNFDPCLETASGSHHGVLAYPHFTLLPVQFSSTILYLHGKARWGRLVKADSLLFTARELDEAYEHSLISSALNQLLSGYPSIFVGCGLQEAVLKNLFKRLKEIHEHTQLPSMQKTILLADEHDAGKRERQQREMAELGIDILRFPLDEHGGSEDKYRYLVDVWAQVREEITHNIQPIQTRAERLS